MNSWVRVNYDIGLPIKVFQVSTREIMTGSLANHFKQALAADCPQTLAELLEKMLRKARPTLGEGLTIIGIDGAHGGMTIQFSAVHLDFPKIQGQLFPEPENIHPCYICGKSIYFNEGHDLCLVEPLPGQFKDVGVCASEDCKNTAADISHRTREKYLSFVEEQTKTRIVEIEPTESWCASPEVFEKEG